MLERTAHDFCEMPWISFSLNFPAPGSSRSMTNFGMVLPLVFLLAPRAHSIPEEVRQRRQLLEVGILLPLAGDAGDGNVSVVMAWIEARLAGKLRDPPQALEH